MDFLPSSLTDKTIKLPDGGVEMKLNCTCWKVMWLYRNNYNIWSDRWQSWPYNHTSGLVSGRNIQSITVSSPAANHPTTVVTGPQDPTDGHWWRVSAWDESKYVFIRERSRNLHSPQPTCYTWTVFKKKTKPGCCHRRIAHVYAGDLKS